MRIARTQTCRASLSMFLGVLIPLLPAAAAASELELRRTTSMNLTEIDCSSQPHSPELSNARVLVRQIASRIMRANPAVFYGDLSPEKICVVPSRSTGQRAWAEADQRLIRIEAGMLLRVRNEAQLAFVIAHELAHVTLRHSPLEGNPIPGESRALANRLLVDSTETFARLLQAPKGSPEQARERHRHDQLQRQIDELFLRHFDAEFTANWLETEAEVAGSIYYMNAGYPASELGWRLDQLVLALDSAGLDPRTQLGGDGFDPHTPPGNYSRTERLHRAGRACRLDPLRELPLRGTHRYAMPCWQIWNLRVNLPSVDSTYSRLYQQASAVVENETIAPALARMKQDLCSHSETRIHEYCTR